jgi:hypothetical protein
VNLGELLNTENWSRKLENAGFRVIKEPFVYRPVGVAWCGTCDRPIVKCRCAIAAGRRS